MISVHFQGRPYITVNEVYAPTTDAEKSWSWPVLWRPTRPSRTNTHTKKCPFIIGYWNAKVGRDTLCNRQVWPWGTTGSRAKPNRVLSREHTDERKHSFPTTQEMILPMEIIRWSIPKSDWLYPLQPKMEKLFTVSKNKIQSSLWSDHDLLIAKFRLKLWKVGKTTRHQVWPK